MTPPPPRAALERRLFGGPLAELYGALSVSRRLSRLVSLLEEDHPRTDLSLSVAAHVCAMERSHLNACLRERTGWTFHRLLVRRRLLAAVERLATTRISVLEIALDSGFGSVRSFERNFSQLLGESPGRFWRRWQRRFRFRPDHAAAAVDRSGPISLDSAIRTAGSVFLSLD